MLGTYLLFVYLIFCAFIISRPNPGVKIMTIGMRIVTGMDEVLATATVHTCHK